MKTAIKVSLAALMGCGALLLVLGIDLDGERRPTDPGAHRVRDRARPQSVDHRRDRGVPAWPPEPWRWPSSGGCWSSSSAAQEELLPGSWHWTIQVLHLAISMGAIWWGRRLVRLIAIAQRPVDSPRLVAGPRVTASGTGST